MAGKHSTDTTSAEVLFERRGRLGVVTLNRPQAVNALTAGMASAMLEQLTLWADDDAVAAVLVRGAGDRGLCAGGDIVAIYRDMLDGGDATAANLKLIAADVGWQNNRVWTGPGGMDAAQTPPFRRGTRATGEPPYENRSDEFLQSPQNAALDTTAPRWPNRWRQPAFRPRMSGLSCRTRLAQASCD